MTKGIEEYIKKFKKDDPKKQQDGRYASFDYCFNYFQEFKENRTIEDIVSEKNLQKSCLQLGFYLASWGMYRGSSFLLQHSCHLLKWPLEVIAKFEEDEEKRKIWKIDVSEYSEVNIKLVYDCAKEIRMSLKDNKCKGCKTINHRMSDTLVTKIMLGVFGCMPAYDEYFKITLKEHGYCQTFNENSLKQIKEFYEDNKDVIDRLSEETKTIDFFSDSRIERNYTYTKAKIIDMYGFMKGLEIDEENKEKKRKEKEQKSAQ